MSNHTVKSPSGSRRGRPALAALAVAVLGGVGLAGPASADTVRQSDAVQTSLDKAVRSGELPGALASVRDANGQVRNYTAGVGDLKTKAEVPVDGQVRIASNTKMFTAVVVLQLAAEGKIKLDAPVEKYLPKVIRGKGNDGRKITTRQLLQHTSGLHSYTANMPSIFKIQHTYAEPHALLNTGLAHKPDFAPGKGWAYSNTGYVALGLLVQQVTGRPIGEEITERIIKPAGLRGTYWPGIGEQGIRGAHPSGYAPKKPGKQAAKSLADVTRLDPSWGWAAGQLVGTPSDLNRFLVALMDGKLLKPAQLKQMKDTMKAPGFPAGWTYGLGLLKIKLSCGGYAYGHGGDIDGYETRTGITKDGRAATIAVTALPTTQPAADKVNKALDTALCS
ncbi:beta-lactamase family protein [Nonomuraea glycinis]|uniref:Serine hydrolase n=1 Tax=Nonomuraea glycinis TaxID=2047744 RepID=A0A918AC13_9ACTN|nr:serine hydrolase domain-containing protein [Nonomuraea glycinis]MCA2181696.1 beta-lactamase family protein [Nonomuraea glycinis]GGP14902.1 serine hydrolase [Nonomuraea glycinis]